MKLGIVGGGQLGLMLAEAAKAFPEVEVLVLDPTPNCPASQVAEQVLGSFSDYNQVLQFGRSVDVVTFEIESANAVALAQLESEGKVLYPKASTLSTIKDKFKQKSVLQAQGIPVADFCLIESRADVEKALQEFGSPIVLKARSGGYDGRGNAVIRGHDEDLTQTNADETSVGAEIDEALQKLAGADLYAEKWMPFTKELAVNLARDRKGKLAFHPLVETVHKNNICHTVEAPAQVSEAVTTEAKRIAEKIMTTLDGVGLFGIELFLTEDDQIVVNEIAPRVHNSGHHTIESCTVSQFEQHLRAVLGLDLVEPDLVRPHACMVNILGDRTGPAKPQGIAEAEAIPETTVHIYGKLETKPERKMGHLTSLGETREEAHERAQRAITIVSI